MNRDDQVFWDRLADMPWIEAEQECVQRREELVLQLGMLETELAKSRTKKDDQNIAEGLNDVRGQLSLLNERIKYLRKAQDTVSWRKAVTAVLGTDAYELVAEYIAKTEWETRRTNPPKGPAC